MPMQQSSPLLLHMLTYRNLGNHKRSKLCSKNHIWRQYYKLNLVGYFFVEPLFFIGTVEMIQFTHVASMPS